MNRISCTCGAPDCRLCGKGVYLRPKCKECYTDLDSDNANSQRVVKDNGEVVFLKFLNTEREIVCKECYDKNRQILT